MANIKKCPWCGHSAVVRPSALGYFVECSKNGHIHNAGCFGFEISFKKNEQEAIKIWNDCVKRIQGGKSALFALVGKLYYYIAFLCVP